MRRWTRRLRANLIYLRRPILRFLPLLFVLVVLLLVGAYCFQHYHDGEQPLSYVEALYVTYSLLFMEIVNPFPDHWLLQVFYFVLPLLGLVVVLDGLVRFGYHVLRRDQSSPEWIKAMSHAQSGHVILCGLGRVGLRVLQELLRLKEDVVVLEKDPDNQNVSFARKNGIPVRIGNGREEDILLELNVEGAKSIILATDDDLANLEMALDARKAHPGIRVVMRMYDQELASKIRESFDMQLAFSTSAQAAPLFATSSSDGSIVNSFYVQNQLLVVANLTVNADSELVGKTIKDLGPKHRMFFLAFTRAGKVTHFPPAGFDFRAADEFTVQTEPDVLKILHQMNRDQQPY